MNIILGLNKLDLYNLSINKLTFHEETKDYL